MKLTCDSCSTPFAPSDVNVELGIASCRRCSAVFDLKKRLGQKAEAKASPEAPVRRRVPMPDRFEVTEEPGLLRIRWRWFTVATIFLLFFCVAWDSFLFFWYSTALLADDTPWLMVVFPLAHVAVGVGLSYTVLAQLFNSSEVEVSANLLRVRHGPIPWRGNVALSAEDVVQLYCDEKRSHTQKGGVQIRYQVNAVLRGNKTVRVVGNLEDKQQALFLEEAIERRLQIADERVAGELQKRGSGAAA